MTNEIVYTCRSINNKNIRGNELKFLRKISDELCFEFGESQTNMKKRFYKDEKILDEDFEEVKKIKLKMEKENKGIIPEDMDSEINNKDKKSYKL